MYFFKVESALELSKRLNNEIQSGLKSEESNFLAVLAITICKIKLQVQDLTK